MKLACSGRGRPLDVIALLALSIKSSMGSSLFPCLPLNFLRLCSFRTTTNCVESDGGCVACAPEASLFCVAACIVLSRS